jgi:holo-[acyl-carrier protein] synthase
MILGLGTDLCPAARWEHLLQRFGEKAPRRVLHGEEADYLLGGNRQRLPERLAGRWALREAFGKALGCHASISHECGMALAVVILEGNLHRL